MTAATRQSGDDPQAVLDALQRVVDELACIERMPSCSWCRGHITAYRVYGEDLLALARMNVDIGDPRVLKWLRKIGEWSDEIGLLATVARLVHRVRHGLHGVH